MGGLVVAVVGLTNAGKTVVSKFLQKKGFAYIRFGQITEDICKEMGLENNEENNRIVRENIRKEHGMAAYALLNMPKIRALLKQGNVVIDNLSAWSSYKLLKERFDNFVTVAVYAPPKLRSKRAESRAVRSTKDYYKNRSVRDRDYAEIENMEKAGPIAMADYTIDNSGDRERLEQALKGFWRWLKHEFKTQLG